MLKWQEYVSTSMLISEVIVGYKWQSWGIYTDTGFQQEWRPPPCPRKAKRVQARTQCTSTNEKKTIALPSLLFYA